MLCGAPASDGGWPMNSPPLCRHCGDVIGVYEPAIALVAGEPRETSRAAERELDPRHFHYHRACFERLKGGASVE